MERFSRFFCGAACVIVMLTAGVPLLSAETSAAQPHAGKIRLFPYEDARTQPSFHAARTADRLRRMAEWCIPSPHRAPWKVTWSVEKDPYLFRFHAQGFGAGKETKITVPAYFPGWIRDPVHMRKLTAWVVLARLGRGPEMADAITGHWIIRALTYKALADSREQAKFYFAKDYPVAWAMASHGIYPALDSVFTTETEDLHPAFREWESEYAALLLEACHRSGFLRESLAEKLLTAVLSGTDGGDARNAFFEEISALEAIKKNRRGHERNVLLNEWFQNNMERSLLSFFMPESPECFETRYWTESECSWVDPDGKVQQCRPSEIPLRRDGIPNVSAVVSGLLSRLLFGREVHPLIRERLSELRETITNHALSASPERASEIIRDAEKKMIRTVDFLVQTEYALSLAQVRLVQPGARMEYLLQSVRRQTREHAAFSGVDELLDKWDDYR